MPRITQICPLHSGRIFELGVGTVIRVSAHIDGGRPIEEAGSESKQLYESRPTLTVVGPSRRQVRSRNSYTSLGPH